MLRALLSLLLLPACGCFNGVLLKPAQVDCPVEETLVTPACHLLCFDKIALIDVEGLIVNARTGGLMSSGDNPVSLFRERLDAAAEDKKVKAVVLRINSPGGGVTASDIMYRDLIHFREETHKPVVACMMDVAASGGYYLAMGCDRVYAHPTTVTGSIGVIMSLYNAHGLAKMIGVSSEPIKSGPNKDIGNPARPMTLEERAILQGMVNGFYDQFVEVVSRARKEHIPTERVRELADGRVYTGVEAKKLGLVDEVGYLEDALKCALDLACLKDANVIAYDNSNCGYRGSIYARGPSIPKEINVRVDVPGLSSLSGLAGYGGSGFWYLWEPGVRK
jgi:protease IV